METKQETKNDTKVERKIKGGWEKMEKYCVLVLSYEHKLALHLIGWTLTKL